MDGTRIRTLDTRAARLRRFAETAQAPLAGAYKRRAAELELLSAVLSPLVVTPDRSPAAAA
jgi:hypothetical protein